MSSLLEGFVGIVGLAVITVVTRAFFLLPEREVPLPEWLRQGLRHAPLAALAAVAVPEVITTHGRLVDTLADARLYGAAVSVAYFFWRRDILGTILSGTAVTMGLRLGLGW